jgi:hypothetical protein
MRTEASDTVMDNQINFKTPAEMTELLLKYQPLKVEDHIAISKNAHDSEELDSLQKGIERGRVSPGNLISHLFLFL